MYSVASLYTAVHLPCGSFYTECAEEELFQSSEVSDEVILHLRTQKKAGHQVRTGHIRILSR